MHVIRRLRFLLLIGLAVYLLPSCIDTRKTVYFNNIGDTIIKSQQFDLQPVIQKSDLLNLSISSLNPEASMIFNSPNTPSAPSTANSSMTFAGSTLTPSAQQLGYLVNQEGTIKLPIIGDVKAAGLTKKQLEDTIASVLAEKKLLIDPIVSVRFLNFRVTVIGEVGKPTTINVVNEKITILEAIGLAGDLTIYGKRENVLLIREDDHEKILKRINLNSPDILSSPYYYLKTNDVVYVEPRKEKTLATSRTQQLLPIFISVLSFIVILVSQIIRN